MWPTRGAYAAVAATAGVLRHHFSRAVLAYHNIRLDCPICLAPHGP
jgi:hypothetical protein